MDKGFKLIVSALVLAFVIIFAMLVYCVITDTIAASIRLYLCAM